jgi:hypothetical protein
VGRRLMNRWILFISALIFTVAFGSTAVHADTLDFQLTANTCSGGCSPSPFGDVVITSSGQPANTVLVKETLTGATQFVNTGSGYALAFSVTGDPNLTIGGLSSGFSIGNALSGSSESRDGAGSFDYWIVCSGCGNGGSPPIVKGPLSFTVSAAGVTPESFEVLNGKGYFLASDVLAGYTGNVEATGFTTTPEPSSLILMAVGLTGLLIVSRRRLLLNS